MTSWLHKAIEGMIEEDRNTASGSGVPPKIDRISHWSNRLLLDSGPEGASPSPS